jgi:aspartyl-tRNA(Asn)/glutamyl-tRNA(Gln) amidotransferase subunit C
MDRAQIRHVALLAELELTPDEEERLASEMGRIVAYFAELDAIDTSNVPPTAHIVTETSPLRPDEVAPGLDQERALAGAPQAAHGGFCVPTFVE